VKIELRSRTRT